MAKPKDIELTGADGVVYRFNFGTNTFCRMEDATGLSYIEVLQRLRNKPTMTFLRTLFQAALVSHQTASLEDVGVILDDVGGPAFLTIVLSSFGADLADPDEPVTAQDIITAALATQPAAEASTT